MAYFAKISGNLHEIEEIGPCVWGGAGDAPKSSYVTMREVYSVLTVSYIVD